MIDWAPALTNSATWRSGRSIIRWASSIAPAACWLLAALLFVVWMFTPAVPGQLLRTEIGYLAATALLALSLALLYRRGAAARLALAHAPATERASAR